MTQISANNTIATMDGTTVKKINVRLVTREQREGMENSVTTFTETYKGKNENVMDFPASIFTLCDYIITTKKEETNWKAVADMFKCFAAKRDTPFEKAFSDAQILVVMAYDKSVTKTNVVEDNIGNAYNEIISRVKVLKKACADILMEKFNE